jgi:uncharacterized protein (TIGR02996 family)
MHDFPTLTGAIAQDPDDRARWLAMAAWFAAHGRDDEAIAVRVLWPTFRDSLAYLPLSAILRSLAESAAVFGSIARQLESDSQRVVG